MTNFELLLKREGLTQREFAKQIGMKESNLSRYVHANRVPKVTIALKIAQALWVQVEDLFDTEGWREV